MSHFKAKVLQIRFPASVRPSVRSFLRPFVFDTVDESQRRRHGVTATIAVDVVAVRVCPSVRPSVRLLDGG